MKNSSLVTRHSPLSLKAPAKINWFLKVCGLRDDGYHEIKSLIQKISLYDVLTFIPSKDLTLITDFSIPVEENLVYKTATLLKKECGVEAGAEIRLRKNIPVASGLGGGSSDAALTLVALDKLWSLGLSIKELCVFAECLGADVPFFLHGPIAFVEGRGEKVIPLRTTKSFDILLVKPPISVSTRWAYGQFRKSLQNTEHRAQSVDNPHSPPFSKVGVGGFASEFQTRDSKPYKGLTKKAEKGDNITHFIHTLNRAEIYKNIDILNDLEAVIVKSFPVIANIKSRLMKEGAIFSMMSGSGPTVFGVFESVDDAKRASLAFRDCWTTVVKTITE